MAAAPATVATLGPDGFKARLIGEGLGLRLGPFDVLLRVRVPHITSALYHLYRHYPLLDADRVFSCHLSMYRVRAWRKGGTPMVRTLIDGRVPHEDMPAAHALPVLEWALNLAIVMRHQGYLMLHSAVVEREGCALLLPASPGHGKTTLCAALAHRGWRFFSDEFGLVKPGTRAALPVPRPMPLKNESIDVIRTFAPDAHLGPSVAGTRKGTVAHVRAPIASIARAAEPAAIRWVVFPRWVAGAALELEPVPKARAFMELATNAFNYEPLGLAAFQTVRQIIDQADCYHLAYSDLEEAVVRLSSLPSAVPA